MKIKGKDYTVHSGNTFFDIPIEVPPPLPRLKNNETRKRHSTLEYIAPFDKERFVELRVQGKGINEIALLMGMSQERLLQERRGHGLHISARYGKKLFTPQVTAKMIDMYTKGASYEEVAKEIGSTATSVRQQLCKNGVPTGCKRKVKL